MKWRDHLFIEELLSNTEYPVFKCNIDKALERGLISSLSIASHVTTIFGHQEEYQLGELLENQTVTSSTVLRWLLIEYGSPSTQQLFMDRINDALKEADKLVKTELQQDVYVQNNEVLIRLTVTKEWIGEVNRCAGALKWWLEVIGEQLILNQRWGRPKEWVQHKNSWGHWRMIWIPGCLEKFTLDLWKSKLNIAMKLAEIGQSPDNSLPYDDLSGNFGNSDDEESKILKFWPQTGKTEWACPAEESGLQLGITEGMAEHLRISAGGFLDTNSEQRQFDAGDCTAPELTTNVSPIEHVTIPQIFLNGPSTDQSNRDNTSQIRPDLYTSGQDTAPHPCDASPTGQDTAPQVLSDRLTTDQTGEDTAPQIQSDHYFTGHTAPIDCDTSALTIEDRFATEEASWGYNTSDNRPCIHIDIADVGERLAVLDAAELGAMEERKQQENRSLEEQTLLDLPQRDRQLEEELKYSADIKNNLLEKLDSDTPLDSKIKAVETFFDAIEEETEKVQGWTEELREAEAEIDRGYDIDWEEETPSEETQANKQITLETDTKTPSPQAKESEQIISRASTSTYVGKESIQHDAQDAEPNLYGKTDKTNTGDAIKPAVDRAVEQLSLDNWSNCSVDGSDTSDYTGAGPISPMEDKTTKEVYTAEEYDILLPLTGN